MRNSHQSVDMYEYFSYLCSSYNKEYHNRLYAQENCPKSFEKLIFKISLNSSLIGSLKKQT